MIEFLTEPLSHDFMLRALFMSSLIGVTCAIFSCFLVLKGWSLMGDAVSHAVLPGLGLSVILGIPLAIGAFAAGLFCALATGYLKHRSRVKEDAVMGIVFSGMFALGLIMVTKIETDLHLLHILFGNVLGITPDDLLQAIIIAGLSIIIMLVKRRDFMLYCFDPNQASAIGLNTKLLQFTLLALLALTIIASLKAAGIILVIAFLIAPGATAFLLTKRFDPMLIIAATTTLASCLSGVLLSYHLDVATAPLIVVIQAFIFVGALCMNLITQHISVKPV